MATFHLAVPVNHVSQPESKKKNLCSGTGTLKVTPINTSTLLKDQMTNPDVTGVSYNKHTVTNHSALQLSSCLLDTDT